MKLFFVFQVIFLGFYSNAQVPKSGIYTYDRCDIEYNKCIGSCKIKIKGNKIWVYAPAKLTLVKEGELIDSGFLQKRSGKWVIVHSITKKQNGSPEEVTEPISLDRL